jgi:hypothetical protein
MNARVARTAGATTHLDAAFVNEEFRTKIRALKKLPVFGV